MTLPEGFVCEFEGLAEGLLMEPSVSVRCNTGKGVSPLCDASLVPWCGSGFYLDQRPAFTFDPAMHQGLYYVQDASSMIHSHIVNRIAADRSQLTLLDACAAPGGKTTAAIDSLPHDAFVVANEYVPARAEILRENLIKWGFPHTLVSRGDTVRFSKLKSVFDIVMADVPCSGEGMFRKEPEAVKQWSPALVEECAVRQREIVDNIWPSLREGGYFIYSTCTFNARENEDVVRYILDNYDCEVVDMDFPAEWNVIERDGCYHFIPGRVRGEGLCVSVLRKGGNPDGRSEKPVKAEKRSKAAVDVSRCREWIANPDDYNLIVENDRVIALPADRVALVKKLSDTLDVLYKGVEVAVIKGRDIVPSHALAMSQLLRSDAFSTAEIDYPAAMSYLRRETITLEDAPSGYILLLYDGAPLGFVKNLGKRANNLYPQNWRILSGHIPESAPTVVTSGSGRRL